MGCWRLLAACCCTDRRSCLPPFRSSGWLGRSHAPQNRRKVTARLRSRHSRKGQTLIGFRESGYKWLQVTPNKTHHFKYLTDSANGKNRSQVSSVIPLTGCTVSWKDNHLARIAGSLWLKTTCQRINDISIGRWRITAWGFDPGRTDEARPNLKKACVIVIRAQISMSWVQSRSYLRKI